jgi:hypothetical protein
MWLAYGVKAYRADGYSIVTNYIANYGYGGKLQPRTNDGTPGYVPLPGDILARGDATTLGHTQVVTATHVDGNGNGTINVLEENNSSDPDGVMENMPVTNWVVQGQPYTVTAWLHAPSTASSMTWSGPTAVPGVSNALSGPDATAIAGVNHIDVLYRATDGYIWDVSYDNGWQAPHRLGGTMPFTAGPFDPGSISRYSGHMTGYATDVNNQLWQDTWTSSGGWSGWTTVPGSAGIVTSAPDAASWNSDHVDIVAGNNGVMNTISWNSGTGWTYWHGLG